MKGVKEVKVDGTKGAVPALFPRLHVAETKKAGPRGPPRNKMAFYEQLTIPSHRYKPSLMLLPSSAQFISSPSMTTPIYQPQAQVSSYDSRYSYMPMSYMSPIIPSMAYMKMGLNGVGVGGGGGTTATSSMNASSTRSTIVDGTTESQRVPWLEETLSSRHMSSGHSKHSMPSKKGKELDDFAVPTYSSATQSSSQARPSINPPQVQQCIKGGRFAPKGKELAMGKRSPACANQLRQFRKERSIEDDSSLTSASVECVTVFAVDSDVKMHDLSNGLVDGVPRECNGSRVDLNASVVGQERVEDQRVDGGQIDEELTKSDNAAATSPEALHEVESLRAVSEQDIISSQGLENGSEELSETSQRRRSSSAETESSTPENLVSGSICFRDVVDAFGQQEFWKAKEIITRQQMIFSRQLFELHRVIEVQHLLSRSPCLSFKTDEVLKEEEDDNVPLPASPVAEVPEVRDRRSETYVRQPSNENSRPVLESHSQPLYPLSIPSGQDFYSGYPWQPATYAANPWAARMSSSYMYVPYPGPCSPGYGVYPMMGTAMPMYGNSGGTQGAIYPAFQQPGMSQPWGHQDAAAAASVWSCQSVVSGVGPTVRTGIVSPASNSERLASSVASQLILGISATKGIARQAGEGSELAVNCSNTLNDENRGWAKGWGGTAERWNRGELDASRNKECVAGPQSDEKEFLDGEPVCGVGQQSDVGHRVVECNEHGEELSVHGHEPFELGGVRAELEPEKSRLAEERHEGPLQGRTLKRAQPEIPESEVFPWFRIVSPAKRNMHQNGVIKVVPRAISATPESSANILLSI